MALPERLVIPPLPYSPLREWGFFAAPSVPHPLAAIGQLREEGNGYVGGINILFGEEHDLPPFFPNPNYFAR